MATTNLNIKTDILRTSIHEHGIPFALKLDVLNEITRYSANLNPRTWYSFCFKTGYTKRNNHRCNRRRKKAYGRFFRYEIFRCGFS